MEQEQKEDRPWPHKKYKEKRWRVAGEQRLNTRTPHCTALTRDVTISLRCTITLQRYARCPRAMQLTTR